MRQDEFTDMTETDEYSSFNADNDSLDEEEVVRRHKKPLDYRRRIEELMEQKRLQRELDEDYYYLDKD